MSQRELSPAIAVLEINPPYRTRIVQHLHHVELEYNTSDLPAVMAWMRGLYNQLALVSATLTVKSVPCPDCLNGYHIDEATKNEVFPEGLPTLCQSCKGTTRLQVNDIIEEEEKTSPDIQVPVCNVVPDDGTDIPMI